MAILETFLQQQQPQKAENIKQIIVDVVSSLLPKNREVIEKRYGLKNPIPYTLDRIGKDMAVTRERIRQIEKLALEALMSHNNGRLKIVIDKIIELIDESNDIMPLNILQKKLNLISDTEKNSLDLMLDLLKDHKVVKENKQFTTFIYHKKIDIPLVEALIKEIISIIDKENKPLAPNELTEKLMASEWYQSNKIDAHFLLSAITISKEITQTEKGSIALTKWPYIKPKNIRDKVFYVLYEVGKPLHFRDITQKIIEKLFDKKRITSAAVHNELIADPRFVLVGRGIYSLTDWGYKQGTVSDIIYDVLKNAGKPMTINEIIDEVFKNKIIQKNTVIVNLQNKNRFKRIDKSTYTITI